MVKNSPNSWLARSFKRFPYLCCAVLFVILFAWIFRPVHITDDKSILSYDDWAKEYPPSPAIQEILSDKTDEGETTNWYGIYAPPEQEPDPYVYYVWRSQLDIDLSRMNILTEISATIIWKYYHDIKRVRYNDYAYYSEAIWLTSPAVYLVGVVIFYSLLICLSILLIPVVYIIYRIIRVLCLLISPKIRSFYKILSAKYNELKKL